MKKTRFLLLFCSAILFLLTACEKHCKIKYPKNIKPIDWENYNDVYTVYWNYHTVSSETNKKIEQDRGKEVMIYGYIHGIQWAKFSLIANKDNSNLQVFTRLFFNPYDDDGYVNFDTLVHQIQTKLDTSDLTKKCFITGKLSATSLGTNYCTWIVPTIIITDINDIYFEE